MYDFILTNRWYADTKSLRQLQVGPAQLVTANLEHITNVNKEIYLDD